MFFNHIIRKSQFHTLLYYIIITQAIINFTHFPPLVYLTMWY